MEYILNHIDPVAFYIGGFPIRWYALAYLSGFLLGWKYCSGFVDKAKPEVRPNAVDIDNFISWAVLGVILGGRLGYVLFYNLDYYISQPLDIFKIWNGGMSFHGGMLGVIVSTFMFSLRHRIYVLYMADIICAAAPIGLFFGRIANFINGELYGRATILPWGVVFPNAGDSPRHPSQLYEALLEGAVLFIILYVLARYIKPRAGVISGVFFVMYGLFRIIIEFVREPDVQIGLIGDAITMGQILCLPMILVGLALVYFVLTGKISPKEAYVERTL